MKNGVLLQSLVVPVLPGSLVRDADAVLAGHRAGRDPLCWPRESSASAETSQWGTGVPVPSRSVTLPGG